MIFLKSDLTTHVLMTIFGHIQEVFQIKNDLVNILVDVTSFKGISYWNIINYAVSFLTTFTYFYSFLSCNTYIPSI